MTQPRPDDLTCTKPGCNRTRRQVTRATRMEDGSIVPITTWECPVGHPQEDAIVLSWSSCSRRHTDPWNRRNLCRSWLRISPVL